MDAAKRKIEELARLVAETSAEELDCGAVLDRIAAYLEQLVDGRKVTAELRTVAQHLKVCPECREEFDALLRAEGLDPVIALDGA